MIDGYQAHWVALIVSSLLLALSLFCRRCVGAWANPASIFSFFWFLYTFIPLVVVWDVPLNLFSIIYIFFFNVLFCSGCLLFNWSHALHFNKYKPPSAFVFGGRVFIAVFVIIALLSFFLCVVDLFLQGIPISSSNILSIGAEYAEKRYGGDLVVSVYSKLSVFLSMPCAVLGGLVWGANRKGRLFYLFIAFLPSVFVMVFQSAKGMFFFSVALFLGGILVTKIYDDEMRDFKISFSGILKISFVGIVVFAGLVISFLSRGAATLDLEGKIAFLKYYFASYSSGHLYAFSEWFSDRYFNGAHQLSFEQDALQMGFYTFMSFYRVIGDSREVPIGIYDEFLDYPGIVTTNIYTVFRGLITDFTLVGSFFFAAFLGLICHAFFYGLLLRDRYFLGSIFFIYFFAISYQSYVVSSLVWLTTPASFLFVAFVVAILARKNTAAA